MILRLLAILLISLGFGNKSQTPKYDLRKPKAKESSVKVLNEYIIRYWGIISIIIVIFALIVFAWACFTFVGASAVESGNVYNHLGDVI